MCPQPRRPWTVLVSYQTEEADRCVDIFVRADGTHGFEEFRRDAEDMGAWTPIGYYSGAVHPNADAALSAAREAVPWLSEAVAAAVARLERHRPRPAPPRADDTHHGKPHDEGGPG
jgi:hypothetical protein